MVKKNLPKIKSTSIEIKNKKGIKRKLRNLKNKQSELKNNDHSKLKPAKIKSNEKIINKNKSDENISIDDEKCSSGNISKNENKDNISINSLDLVDSNYKFEFFLIWSIFVISSMSNSTSFSFLVNFSIDCSLRLFHLFIFVFP